MIEPVAPTEQPSGISLAAGERVVLVGTPGTGKTHLTQWLLEGVSSVVVLDSKLDPKEWAAWGPRHGFVVARDPRAISQHRRVIFQVEQTWLDDTEGWDKPGRPGFHWSEVLRRLLARGSSVVVFDEALQTLPAGRTHPQARRVFTQGRSLGLSVWAGTQVANRAETLVFRLAEHCFAFRTLNGQDLALISRARGLDCSELKDLEPYHFAYHHVSASEWRICGPVEAP